MQPTVLAAIDLGPSSARVLQHAAGFARLLEARLKVLHATSDTSSEALQRVQEFCQVSGAYDVDLNDEDVMLRSGHVSEAIQREALREHAALIVIGSRGHGAIARLILGSTSEALLKGTTRPVLLVPPVDLDIVSFSGRPALTCGPVIAAVDLSEVCNDQLQFASKLAKIAGQPLMLITVAPKKFSDHQAAMALRDRGHGLEPVRPTAMIVRRGDVAEEISKCAITEDSALVIMGVRSRPRSKPGVIASEVLKTKRAFVLAVPGCGGSK